MKLMSTISSPFFSLYLAFSIPTNWMDDRLFSGTGNAKNPRYILGWSKRSVSYCSLSVVQRVPPTLFFCQHKRDVFFVARMVLIQPH